MMHRHSVKRIAQATAVLLLAYTATVRADDCAGGTDATGNECNGERSTSSRSNAAFGPAKADARIVSAKQAETSAQKELAEARVRHGEAVAAVKLAETRLVAARKASAEAAYAPRR